MDNFEEYQNPILYDTENDTYTDDIEFLLKWTNGMRGPILDIACGTGRGTIPLAKRGLDLIGVDIHAGMLEEAKRKAEKLELQINWVGQDCRTLNLDVKSPLAYTIGNSFQHFLTNEDQDSFLSSVHRHLEANGLFIFGTRFPNEEELLAASEEELWRTYDDPQTGLTVDVFGLSTYDSLNQIQHNKTMRRFRTGAGKVVDEKTTNISLRYVYPKEMERILSANGFRILHAFGDWRQSPLTNESTQMIYVCLAIL
ncbi:methyltransferase [Bacillus sp. FJAT-27225]|uniref:class I SAM-dependent methyltransferase n=1 Tax=Bacillus sp. FJAT-27225 TaxID=1743144 RepID=UPI00080C216A|nr:class I SAM-dependent methyltransferase [Bacillus sp. FJAT-27225]OCA87929.1 methyltransferase [Bacillus sp. FJAT-27225]